MSCSQAEKEALRSRVAELGEALKKAEGCVASERRVRLSKEVLLADQCLARQQLELQCSELKAAAKREEGEVERVRAVVGEMEASHARAMEYLLSELGFVQLELMRIESHVPVAEQTPASDVVRTGGCALADEAGGREWEKKRVGKEMSEPSKAPTPRKVRSGELGAEEGLNSDEAGEGEASLEKAGGDGRSRGTASEGGERADLSKTSQVTPSGWCVWETWRLHACEGRWGGIGEGGCDAFGLHTGGDGVVASCSLGCGLLTGAPQISERATGRQRKG